MVNIVIWGSVVCKFISGFDVSVNNKRRSVLLSSDSIMTDSEDSYDTVMQIYISCTTISNIL